MGERVGTKASATRISKIASKTKRLANLDSVKRFVYSPTGENRGRDSLNHSEVIQLTSHFLTSKPAMQSILVGRYPFLLIDESQDTNKNLIDALFAVQVAHKGRFALGLLGDMMQRIYSDGKDGLGQNLPGDWPSLKLRASSNVSNVFSTTSPDFIMRTSKLYLPVCRMFFSIFLTGFMIPCFWANLGYNPPRF